MQSRDVLFHRDILKVSTGSERICDARWDGPGSPGVEVSALQPKIHQQHSATAGCNRPGDHPRDPCGPGRI
jgi:hypothetical protein